jgi:hypothetical protein
VCVRQRATLEERTNVRALTCTSQRELAETVMVAMASPDVMLLLMLLLLGFAGGRAGTAAAATGEFVSLLSAGFLRMILLLSLLSIKSIV